MSCHRITPSFMHGDETYRKQCFKKTDF